MPENFHAWVTPLQGTSEQARIRLRRSRAAKGAGGEATWSGFAFLFLFFFFSCNTDPVQPLKTTFYHWQTTLAPDTIARALLTEYDCDRLYVKAFDVAWTAGRPEPRALIRLEDTSRLPTLVPVVFISNEVFTEQPPGQLQELADNVVDLVEELLPQGLGELQLDCDWTARTQVQYFAFLKAVRERLGTGRELTCTVRLHQYRDTKTQGIPPVDRATLMAYNVGDLNRWDTENSIIDTNILKTYLSGTKGYPLNLDLAVAVYDWAAVYRRDNLGYLINEPDLAELKDTTRFRALSNDGRRYEIIQSTYLDGIYLYQGDLLRREVAAPELVDAQAALLRRYVAAFPGQRLMVYRLGSRLWE